MPPRLRLHFPFHSHRTLQVDVRSAVHLVATVVKWLSLAYLLPLGVAAYYGEDFLPFLIPMLLALGLGWGAERATRGNLEVGLREGFLVVALAWLVIAAFGALPYLLIGGFSPLEAYFEAMSGFTTTGATILTDIEGQPRGLLIWRQFTQWLGGMGIIVLAIAILPKLSVGGRQLMDAEAPGPGVEKLTPRIRETARALWGVYLGLTLLEVALLKAAGVSLYDSVAHAFTTMATGGFSTRARSLEAFSPPVQWLVVPFIVLAGTNFALMYRVLHGNLRALREDGEFRAYLGFLLGGWLLLSWNLLTLGSYPVGAAIRHGAFQAASILTTTGYVSVDFDRWDGTLKLLLLLLMFVGGCAGSTGGSIKVVRLLLIFKLIARELRKLLHPQAVIPLRLGRRVIAEEAVRGIAVFAVLYVITFAGASVALLLDAQRVGMPLSVLEGTSAVAATLGNVGPAFGIAGPMASYASFPDTSKALMIFLMWAGRLELFPVLVLFTRGYWRR